MSRGPCGLAILDKPAGPTSHDVVARARRALGERRVGHAGTLDPPATGVLLVGVGPATRLLRFLAGTDKAYDGTLVLGVATTTLDATGEVTARHDMAHVTPIEVAAAATSLTGTLAQLPPMVSAVKVGGRRLHALAREGADVERAPREVTVSRFEVEPQGPSRYRFVVECSAGTYVRSLVDDLGRALGGAAHVASLRRTRSGRFTLNDAVELARLERDGRAVLRPARDMVAHLGAVVVDARGAADLRHGRRVASAPGTPGEVAALDAAGALVAVARREADGTLHPEVVLPFGGDAHDD